MEAIYKIDFIRAIRGFRAQPVLVTLANPSDVEAKPLEEESIKLLSNRSSLSCEDELEKIVCGKISSPKIQRLDRPFRIAS